MFVFIYASVLRRTTNTARKSMASVCIHVAAKLGALANTLDACTAIQRDLDWLEKSSNKNIMKFSKGKCHVLQLSRNDPMHQYTLGARQLESSFAAEALGVPLDTK